MQPAHRNQRSAAAQLYRAWYSTARWRRIREAQLTAEPLCRSCKAAGRITAATVCDHIEPHRGDPTRFWAGPFQSLCDAPPWRCHSSGKQSEEAKGYSDALGADGLPSDPRHPFNAGQAQ